MLKQQTVQKLKKMNMQRMGDYPAAESIVDRLKNNAYKVELKGEVSMRERCMDEELRAYAGQKKD